MKTIKSTLDVGNGVKITVERPYTEADATRATDVLSTWVTDTLSTESVAALSGSIGSASGHVGLGSGLPFGFPSFAHIPAGDEQVIENVLAAMKAPRIGDAEGEMFFRENGKLTWRGQARIAYDLLKAYREIHGTESMVKLLRETTGVSRLCDVRKDQLKAAIKAFTSKALCEALKPALKPKRVAHVATDALSTWEFQSSYLQRMYGQKVHLVGQHYRGKLDQEVLGWKRLGNMALLVAEPDNPVDFNAIMVLMWNDQTKHWHHVGYVRVTEAAVLRGKWTGDYKNVMVARISAVPLNSDGHHDGRNIELTLTGEVRTYPGYPGYQV